MFTAFYRSAGGLVKGFSGGFLADLLASLGSEGAAANSSLERKGEI
jgi:hypothetical protein